MPLFLVPLALIALPLLEIGVFIFVGGRIGIGWTLLLVVAGVVLGAALLKRQTLSTIAEARREAAMGRVPERQIVHGALIALAGILLMVPGFVTDVFGLLLFLPPVRDLLWRRLRARVAVRAAARPPAARTAGPEIVDLTGTEFTRHDADQRHGPGENAESPWHRDEDDDAPRGGPRPTLH